MAKSRVTQVARAPEARAEQPISKGIRRAGIEPPIKNPWGGDGSKAVTS